MPKKIAIALSGGVDSSVSAYLLKQAGAELTAVFLRFYARNSGAQMRIDQDQERAKKVADQLGIAWQVLDFSQEQEELVVNNFVNSYAEGESPNPCIICNQKLKFGQLLNWAAENQFDFLATGHYARIEKNDTEYQLLSAQDQQKDQSYFLCRLNEKQLAKLIFPLAKLKKTTVKLIAQENNLLPASQKESFDVCFLNNTKLSDFLKNKLDVKPGKIIDQNGLVIGQHQGVAFYTIGQRQGLEIDHRLLKSSQIIKFKAQEPPALFVIAKNAKKNELLVGEKGQCFKNEFLIRDLSFVNASLANKWQAEKKLNALIKIRNTGQLVAAQVTEKDNLIEVKTAKALFALAPGQSAAFYQQQLNGLRLIAGAIIDNEAEAS